MREVAGGMLLRRHSVLRVGCVVPGACCTEDWSVEGVAGGSGGRSAVQQIARGGEIQKLGLSLLLSIQNDNMYVSEVQRLWPCHVKSQSISGMQENSASEAIDAERVYRLKT
jgi:hypothetical protein